MSTREKKTKSMPRKPRTHPMGPTKPQKIRKASGLDAAFEVLKEAKQPMRCRDIVQTMLDNGMWTSDGKTPHATIYAAILREIQTKGDRSRFVKTERGWFTGKA